MGVLEDAIREHFELKRRHGTSEDELRRQEAEALGPARREAPGAEEQAEAEAAPEVDRGVFDRERPLEPATEADEVPSAESLAAVEEGGTLERALEVEEEPVPPLADQAELEGGPAAPRDSALEDLPPAVDEPAPAASSSTPPRGFPAVTEDGVPVEEGEDVGPDTAGVGEQEPAEETQEESADFLDESPEQDRFRFEHPPRDFDFD